MPTIHIPLIFTSVYWNHYHVVLQLLKRSVAVVCLISHNKESEMASDCASPLGIVFLHGSGDSGEGFREWLESYDSFKLSKLDALNIKYRFPSASAKPYTLNGGYYSNVWHDRSELELCCHEDLVGIKHSMALIDEEIDSLIHIDGIPCSNIFIWGLSMGGHMALQAISLSKHSAELAGIIGLSCFLSTSSHIWSMNHSDTNGAKRIPPIKMIHGEADDLIPCEWGRTTSKLLADNGLDVTFSTIPNLRHDLSDEEVADVMKWILSKRSTLE